MIVLGEILHLTPTDLVKRWGKRISKNTLANWRSKNIGPAYTKFGGVLYPITEVEAYEKKHFGSAQKKKTKRKA